jgi:hypothetical protein
MSKTIVYMPDWLAALRCPICGDVRLSLAWKAPDYIPEILAGFGPRHPPAGRWIVIKLDTMATDLWAARHKKPAFGVQKAKVHFTSTASAAKNLLNKLQEPQVRGAIIMAARRKQIRKDGPKWLLAMDLDAWRNLDAGTDHDLGWNFDAGWDFDVGEDPGAGTDPDAGKDLQARTPLDAIDLILELIREGSLEVLRDLDIYYRPLGRRVANSRKRSPERFLLWEPLFNLMQDFKVEEFDRYQPLIQTVRSLHLALGIDPPDANLLNQVTFLWRKRRLNSAS